MLKSKLLITGSQGIIGQTLVNRLARKYEIIGLDVVDSQQKNYFKVDLSDYSSIESVFQEVKNIDFVIHLAADSHPDALWNSVLKNNIVGTKNIFEAASKYKVKKVIFASTIHVSGIYKNYLTGPVPAEKISVQQPITPDGYYASSKAFGEAVARQFYDSSGLSVVCLRIGAFLADNDPTKDKQNLRIWISHDDFVQLVVKVLNSKIGFDVYYAVSNNTGLFVDIEAAKKDFGYHPKDDSAELLKIKKS